MIHVRSVAADVRVGEFHGVVGVDCDDNILSIYINSGVELMIPIVRHYSSETQSYAKLEVTGMFQPEKLEIKAGRQVEGIAPLNVTGVTVRDMKRFKDFCTKELQIHTHNGLAFLLASILRSSLIRFAKPTLCLAHRSGSLSSYP